MNRIIEELPENLNANVVHSEEFEVASVELDEQWSYVGKKRIHNGYGLISYGNKTGTCNACRKKR